MFMKNDHVYNINFVLVSNIPFVSESIKTEKKSTDKMSTSGETGGTCMTINAVIVWLFHCQFTVY